MEESSLISPSLPNLLLPPTHSISSWNTNSLSLYSNDLRGIARRNNVFSNLRALKQSSKILCLQETKLSPHDKLALSTSSLFRGWSRLLNNHASAEQGGTMVLISPFIQKNYHIQHTIVEQGRVQLITLRPKCESAGSPDLKIFNCYFPTGGLQLNDRRISIFQKLLSYADDSHTILLGDMNFVENPDDSVNPEKIHSLSNEAKSAWEDVLHAFKLHEVHQPNHTFLRIHEAPQSSQTSRLDRVYISHSEADQTLHTPVVYLPAVKHTALTANEGRNAKGKKLYWKATSDHFPIVIKFIPTAPSKKREFNIPSWVGDSKAFKDHFDKHWVEKRRRCPFARELAFRQQVISSAKAILRTPSNSATTNTLSSLTRAIAIFRMAIDQKNHNDKMMELTADDKELASCLMINNGHLIADYEQITSHINKLLKGASPKPDPDETARPKMSRATSIIKSLKAELPSSRSRLVHIKEEGRDPEDSPQGMADIIKEFWGGIWKRRTGAPSEEVLDDYLQRYQKIIPPNLMPQLPSLYHFVAAIEDTNNSSAGRDGIPFSCYRALRFTAAPILQDVFMALAEGRSPPAGFNHGRLYVIPKDTSYTIDRTRPIVVNNAANRILTSVMVELVTPALQHLIEASQKGFIEGRQGTEHVVDLNTLFYDGIRQRENVFILFLDTEKAFDSVDQQFIAAVLNRICMPPWCIDFIMSLFVDVLVFPVLSEKTSTSIKIERGVKQGCPLSPLLFALCYDVLLVYLAEEDILQQFAFADDLAIAGGRNIISRAMVVIEAFSKATGLGINRNKTVIIKTRPFTTNDRAFFKATSWPKVKLVQDQVYLGVLFGRNVDTAMVFMKAMEKFTKRLAEYRGVLQRRTIDHRIILVNVFLTSLFSYLMQFFIMPKVEVIDKVRNAIRRAVIPFNGGAFAYSHLVTQTRHMGFRTPLRDLWAAGIASLTKGIDFTAFHGREHPPLLPHKPYLDNHNWHSMHIEDHRDAASLDILHHDDMRDINGLVITNFHGSEQSKRVYDAAITQGFLPEVMSTGTNVRDRTSLPSKLSRTWGLTGGYAEALRENALDIGKWIPAIYISNHIKLLFNALATDDKRYRRGGAGDADRIATGMPCYLCGEGRDTTHHIFARCEVIRQARHIFLHEVKCCFVGIETYPAEVLATATYPINTFPPALINALISFNYATWEHSRSYFRSRIDTPPIHEGARRIATYATSLWIMHAPKKLRIGVAPGRSHFLPPLPANPVLLHGAQSRPS